MAVQDVIDRLKGVRKRDLLAWLETEKRVREWLANGALLSTQEVAELAAVERSRVWRWEQEGKLKPVRDAGATKLYLRAEVEKMLREHPPQRRRRRGAVDPDEATT